MVKRFVVVAGNIGVGKSTLVDLLGKRLECTPYYEPVTENPYLPDFYEDMPAWAFHSQVFFLAHRLRIHRQLLDHASSVIQDRCVYEDAEIFARNLYRQGAMRPRDFQTYCDLYEVLSQLLPPPDLVIYLRASVSTLISRISRRGRDYEQDISPAYLEDLNELYEAWIADFTLCPVLAVPTDDFDFVSRPSHLDLVVEKVREKLSGKEEVRFDAG